MLVYLYLMKNGPPLLLVWLADDVTDFCKKKGIIKRGNTADEDMFNLQAFGGLPTIVDIRDEAVYLQAPLDPAMFNERQIDDIGLVKGNLSIVEYLCNVAGNSAGIMDDDGSFWKDNPCIMRA